MSPPGCSPAQAWGDTHAPPPPSQPEPSRRTHCSRASLEPIRKEKPYSHIVAFLVALIKVTYSLFLGKNQPWTLNSFASHRSRIKCPVHVSCVCVSSQKSRKSLRKGKLHNFYHHALGCWDSSWGREMWF